MTDNRAFLLVPTLGLATLVLCLLALRLISPGFDYFTPWLERPTYPAVALMVLAGGAFCTLIYQLTRDKLKLSLPLILGLGLALRLLFFGSTPIFEDDFYRYFFDGSLVTQGLNPYAYAPQQARPQTAPPGAEALGIEDTPIHPDLQFLATVPEVEQVAYPHIRTIYPPLTQAFFALASVLNDFHLDTWRGVLLLVEGLTLWLLLQLLRMLGRPPTWVAIYWLNPIGITETLNAAHMDVLLLPFLIMMVLLAQQQRLRLAGVSLGLAVGVKIWPLLLAPWLFRHQLLQPLKLLKVAWPLVLISLLMLLPQLLTQLDQQAGVAAYASSWHTNSFIFGYLLIALQGLEDAGLNMVLLPSELARICTVLMLGAIVFWQCRRRWADTNSLVSGCLVLTASLFLLSPTGYPWYLLWFLPWLAVKPSMPLLLLTATLPLYDLRYPLQLIAQKDTFDTWIVPLIFAPTWLLLIRSYWQQHKK